MDAHQKMQTEGKARFRAVVDSGRFVGLTYVIGDDRVKTLMFLAIDELARDGGYGSAILKSESRYPDQES